MHFQITTLIAFSLALIHPAAASPSQTEGFADTIGGTNGFVTPYRARRGIDAPPTRADVLPVAEPINLAKRAGPCGTAPSGVPQNVYDNCCSALKGKILNVNSINTGKNIPDLRVKGIPYACISAAPWFTNTRTPPFACGDDCLQWTGLSASEYTQAKAIFDRKHV